MKIYMCVTQDKYQIPIDFDTSACRLARRLGYGDLTVLRYISRIKSGDIKPEYPRYICVEVDDGNDVHESNHR